MNVLVYMKAFGLTPPSPQLPSHPEQASAVPPPQPVVSNLTRRQPQHPRLASPPPQLSLRCPLQPRGDIGHEGCQRLTLPACPLSSTPGQPLGALGHVRSPLPCWDQTHALCGHLLAGRQFTQPCRV